MRATQTPLVCAPAAILLQRGAGRADRPCQWHRHAFANVHPLIMTLGTGLIGTGWLQVCQRGVTAIASEVPGLLAAVAKNLTAGVPNVLAAVSDGTSIIGGRGSYPGTVIGAVILTVLGTLLTLLQMPEGPQRILKVRSASS